MVKQLLWHGEILRRKPLPEICIKESMTLDEWNQIEEEYAEWYKSLDDDEKECWDKRVASRLIM